MLALGSVKALITDSVKSGRVHFDMHGFLTSVILADLNLSGTSQHSAGVWVPLAPGIPAALVLTEGGAPGAPCQMGDGLPFAPEFGLI